MWKKRLHWNGVYTTDGACNHDPSVPAVPSDKAPGAAHVVSAAKNLSADQESVGLTHDDAVKLAVKVLAVGTDLQPFAHTPRAAIGLQGADAVQSLLLRVYRNKETENPYEQATPSDETLVYQELLKGTQIDDLEDATGEPAELSEAVSAEDARAHRRAHGYGQGYGHPLDSPYQWRVWVSVDDDAFDACSADKSDPVADAAGLVHDQFVTADQDSDRQPNAPWTGHDEVGVNLTRFKVPKVRVLMVASRTSEPYLHGYATYMAHRGDPNHRARAEQTRAEAFWKSTHRLFKFIDRDGATSDAHERKFYFTYDPELRVRYLFARIDEALAQCPADGADVLRVVMAPEWFFRKGDPGDQYTRDEVGEILRTLCDLSNKPQYANLLIIPGSIIWGLNSKINDKTPIFNTLPVVRHGEVYQLYHKRSEGSDESGAQIFTFDPKFHPPGTITPEFINQLQAGMATKTLRASCSELAMRNEFVDGANTGFFYCEGLSFGVEICADHGSGKMKAKYGELYPEGRGVDIYAYVACGAPSPNKTHVVAREGGCVLACDGSKRSLSHIQKMHSYVVDVTKRDGTVSGGSVPTMKRREMSEGNGAAVFNKAGDVNNDDEKDNAVAVAACVFSYRELVDLNQEPQSEYWKP